MRQKYPNLVTLAIGFLNEDFESEYPDASAAVADFRRVQGLETCAALSAELQAILNSLSETEIKVLWEEDIQATYRPDRDGLTYRDWFENVRIFLLSRPR